VGPARRQGAPPALSTVGRGVGRVFSSYSGGGVEALAKTAREKPLLRADITETPYAALSLSIYIYCKTTLGVRLLTIAGIARLITDLARDFSANCDTPRVGPSLPIGTQLTSQGQDLGGSGGHSLRHPDPLRLRLAY